MFPHYPCRYFLLQRCWQFVATERPSFSTIHSDLSHLAEKPTRHILLKASKDPSKPGHVSENGQVFLRALAPQALQEEDGPPQRKGPRRSSGTMRSLISSIDDTVYTRETAETTLDLTTTQSETENDNYNNYERYLRGDLPPSSLQRRSYDETDTSGNDIIDPRRGRPRSAPRKVSALKTQEGEAERAEVESVGEVSATSSSRRKKRPRAQGKEKTRKAVPGFQNKGFATTTEGGGGGRQEESEDGSSGDGPPSITEDDDKEGVASDSSGSDMGGSQSQLVQLLD